MACRSIQGAGVGLAYDARRQSREGRSRPSLAIPYSTWANRGRGQMIVWLASAEAAAQPTPWPTSRRTEHRDDIGRGPQSRRHQRRRRSRVVERPGVVLRLVAAERARPSGSSTRSSQPATVSEVEVYWFDDTGDAARSACRRRGVCSIKTATTWKPVAAQRRVRRGEGSLQQGDLRAGHDQRPAPRGHDCSRRGLPAFRNGRRVSAAPAVRPAESPVP